MQLKDRKQTAIKASAITSCYQDHFVNNDMKSGGTWPSIKLTIGSTPIELVYDKFEERDADLEEIKKALSY